MLNTTRRMHVKTVFMALALLAGFNAMAQKQDALDSTLYYLNQFTGVKEKDSMTWSKVLSLRPSFKPQFLADKRYEQAMLRLKSTLKPDQYYSVANTFLEYTNYTCTTGEYNYPLDYGLKFIEELKSWKSQTQRFILLKAIRDLRVPFRNSSRIYEGIETYSTLASYFQQQGDSSGISIAYNALASLYNTLGLADKAEYFQLKSIDYLDDKIYPDDNSIFGYRGSPNIGLDGKINRKSVLASYLVDIGEYNKAIQQLHEAFALGSKDSSGAVVIEPTFMYLQMARAKVFLKADSVDYYFNLMRSTLGDSIKVDFQFAHYFQEKSFGFYMEGQLDSAEVNILKCIRIMEDGDLPTTNIMGSLTPGYYLALVRIKQSRLKEAISALQPEITTLRALNLRRETLAELKLLAEAYTLDGDYAKATRAYKDYSALSDEMIEEERNNRSLSFDIEKRIAENEKAVQSLETENKYNQKRQYYLLGIIGLVLLLVFGLLTRNRFKQKVNKELLRKNKEIETTLNQLQSTQAQLIQSEKMASLGELTAGIAHEIQNPLNFINNFAEVNAELIDELNDSIEKNDLPEVKSISRNIKENESKIIFHGKRADAIVKGMLQHSRSSNGTKEPTDINALADEYLRLAYHGLRAKDKTFNATMKTDYDPAIGLINIVPQDIGRVILNLITNAFYAVSAPQPTDSSAPWPPEGGKNYAPTVTIKTNLIKSPLGDLGAKRSIGDIGTSIVEISVSDNGPGIPASVLEKIFQPFFTTKPTGQGTGLGLSLSYDIVKAHGGVLKVETKEGEGSVFIIQLPIS